MTKYVYPAIFTDEGNGQYSVLFPDLEGFYTSGESLEESIEMAEDVLALVLYGYETDKRVIPSPSRLSDIHTAPNEFVNYVRCDTMEYRKIYASKAVKKTLTIPEWMNHEATSLGINFSQVLQEALLQKINR